MRRKLVLRREELADLSPDSLRQVAGATHIFTDCGCITHGFSCDACPVPTVPVNTCVTCLTCGCPVPTLPLLPCLGDLTGVCVE